MPLVEPQIRSRIEAAVDDCPWMRFGRTFEENVAKFAVSRVNAWSCFRRPGYSQVATGGEPTVLKKSEGRSARARLRGRQQVRGHISSSLAKVTRQLQKVVEGNASD